MKLKGTDISIGEQFPIEIQKRRKELMPALKSAKDRSLKVSLVRDKLYIEGKLYNPKKTEAMEV